MHSDERQQERALRKRRKLAESESLAFGAPGEGGRHRHARSAVNPALLRSTG
jgi:hypothetical protein